MAPAVGLAARMLPAIARGLPFVGRTVAPALAGDPRSVARTLAQGAFVLTSTAWVILGLNGRRIAKAMEEGKDRTFDAAAFEFSGGPSGGGGLGARPDGSGKGSPESKSGSVDDWIKDGFTISGAFPYTDQGHNAMRGRIMQESTGNPDAVNDWDINARNGTPSKGLVQLIKPTWEANAVPGYEDFEKWWSYPRLSVATSLNYMRNEYGYIVGSNGQGY